MNKLKILLERCSAIIDKYEEIQKLTGENFNIFSILDKERNEVRTHSAFIGELLNPNGSHSKGTIYLELFFDMLREKTNEEGESIGISETIDKNSVKLYLERYVGKELGIDCRLDIQIESNDLNICIENKIDAKDAKLQLERYSVYLDKQVHKDVLLLYLTIEGEKYKNQDKKRNLKAGSDYYCLSYKKDILYWLDLCVKASYDSPLIRESIQQYIYLVKKISHQLTSNKMSKEVHAKILSDLKSAEIIKNEYDSAIKDITDKLKKDVINELKNRRHIEIIYSRFNNNKYSCIFLEVDKNSETIGVESFIGTGHRNGSLFIGKIEFDGSKRKKEIKYMGGAWVSDSVEHIWSKDELFSKIEEYVVNPKKIVEELVQIVLNYIDKSQ